MIVISVKKNLLNIINKIKLCIYLLCLKKNISIFKQNLLISYIIIFVLLNKRIIASVIIVNNNDTCWKFLYILVFLDYNSI